MTSQIEPYDPIMTRQRRHPLKPAPGIAHRGVQQQDRVGLAPRIGEIVDVIGKPKSVRRSEGAVHLLLVPGMIVMRHSTLMLALSITVVHCWTSACHCASACCGEFAIGENPRLASFFSFSGS